VFSVLTSLFMNSTRLTGALFDTSTNQPDTMPRVVIDLEKLRHINCGLGRFSLYLAQELLARSDNCFEPVFFLPEKCDHYFAGTPNAKYGSIKVHPWNKESFQRWVRPIGRHFKKDGGPRLWHVTHQTSKYLPFDDRMPVVLTVHDLNFLHMTDCNYRPERIHQRLARIQKLVTRATAIVTVSKYTATDLAKHIDVGSKDIHVVPNGLTPPSEIIHNQPSWTPKSPFIFSIGNFLQHKNFHTLIEMMKHLPDYKLVIAGKKDTPYGRKVIQSIKQSNLTSQVLLPGIISDTERAWLYQNCDVFAFPSLTEGFGFPVLEAMQCGKPVAISNRTSLPEVAGESGMLFPSYEPVEMAMTVQNALSAFQSDPQSAIRSRKHAATYSWQAAAKGYADVYKAVLER